MTPEGKIWTILKKIDDALVIAPRAGFEPATTGLTVQRSTVELPRNNKLMKFIFNF